TAPACAAETGFAGRLTSRRIPACRKNPERSASVSTASWEDPNRSPARPSDSRAVFGVSASRSAGESRAKLATFTANSPTVIDPDGEPPETGGFSASAGDVIRRRIGRSTDNAFFEGIIADLLKNMWLGP